MDQTIHFLSQIIREICLPTLKISTFPKHKKSFVMVHRNVSNKWKLVEPVALNFFKIKLL